MEKTRFRLNICGVEITVSGDVDEAQTQKIAETVRSRMQRILNTAYAASVDKAAVITAMNLCEELAGQTAELEAARAHAAELEEKIRELQANTAVTAPVQEAVPDAVSETAEPKKPLRNPFRPDFGDQTGLVSFFAREGAEEQEEEEE